MIYGDDDHYRVNYKKADEAEVVPCAGKSMHLIVSGVDR